MEKPKNRILLGCVADDFTGASDAASFLRNAGLRTLLMNEIQKDFPVPEQIDAVVIALKSRTEATDVAVHSTLEQLSGWKTRGPRNSILNTAPLSTLQKGNNRSCCRCNYGISWGNMRTILCPALP